MRFRFRVINASYLAADTRFNPFLDLSYVSSIRWLGWGKTLRRYVAYLAAPTVNRWVGLSSALGSQAYSADLRSQIEQEIKECVP